VSENTIVRNNRCQSTPLSEQIGFREHHCQKFSVSANIPCQKKNRCQRTSRGVPSPVLRITVRGNRCQRKSLSEKLLAQVPNPVLRIVDSEDRCQSKSVSENAIVRNNRCQNTIVGKNWCQRTPLSKKNCCQRTPLSEKIGVSEHHCQKKSVSGNTKRN